jgi:hypothetical protein
MFACIRKLGCSMSRQPSGRFVCGNATLCEITAALLLQCLSRERAGLDPSEHKRRSLVFAVPVVTNTSTAPAASTTNAANTTEKLLPLLLLTT